MFLGGGILCKNKVIFYSCLVALSATSTVGIVCIENSKSTFSSWGRQIGGLFSNASSYLSFSTDSVTPALIQAGTQIASVVTTHMWPFLTSSVGAFANLRTTYTDFFGSIKHFLMSLVDSEIFYRIFQNLHMKLWNVTSFFVSGGASSDFIALFKNQELSNTLKVGKFLLGLPLDGNNNFKAKPNVFNYLLLKWMDDPSKITKKFKSLSDSIKKLTNNSSSGGGSGGTSSALSGSGTYELEIPTLEQFLNIEKQHIESWWKLFWGGEVVAKIKGQTDVVGGLRSWLFNLWTW